MPPETRYSKGAPSTIGTSRFTTVSKYSSPLKSSSTFGQCPIANGDPGTLDTQSKDRDTLPKPFCQALEAAPETCRGMRKKPGSPPVPAVKTSSK